MTPIAGAVLRRQPCQGVRLIVRFNWPFYALAASVIGVSLVATRLYPSNAIHDWLSPIAALTGFWSVGSLVASWIVYDGSSLMKGTWMVDALESQPRTWINIHAGFDETSAVLHAQFDSSSGRAFDIFDPIEMTESSIGRARLEQQASLPQEQVDFRHLPVSTDAVDAVFLLLSAHELRTDHARCALFEEVRRVIRSTGRVIVVEHLRDAANFVAYGPGFLHFHSRRTWMRSFEQAGLAVHREFAITPFVRVFVLEKSR
jgi:SAM-dependent methyltransferase